MASWRHRALLVASVLAIFAVTALCYSPSLSGPFIFDDTPNLELLGTGGGIDSLESFMEFVSSAQAGPLGRPLSLASFVVDGQTWPTDPRPFRVTNLLIHLVNGLLVLLLARAILVTSFERDVATRLALLCMALWILHPLLVSTTAYVIQRMTQLSALFVLTGLLCYLRGRTILDVQPGRAWTWIVLGMGLSGLLAILSKESGILLPLYALVLEFTIFSRASLVRARKVALVTMLCLPLLALVTYFAANWDAQVAGFEFRPYTMPERLMTQAVVLAEYAQQVFAPHMSGLGIIHDDFPVSKSLLDPWFTLPSLLGIIAAVAFAVWQRRRRPIVSLGILWFFAGHSLEAGPFPLEIYFDHRNYLPLVGPLLAVCSVLPSLPVRIGRLAYAGVVLFLCFEAFLTWQSARLWSDEHLMMQVTAMHHPESLRVQQYIGNQYILAGRFDEALEVQESIAANFPEHTSTRLSILNLSCVLGEVTPRQISATRAFLERGSHDHQIVSFFPVLMARATEGACPPFDVEDFRELLDATLQNPRIGGNGSSRGAAHLFKGITFYEEGRLNEAIEQLDQSFEARPEIDIRLRQVVWLIAAGRPEDAQRYLDRARDYKEGRLWRRSLREGDIRTLQQQIDAMRRMQPQQGS